VALEKRRLEALRLLKQGRNQSEVARQVHVVRQSVSRWAATERDGGKRALRTAGRAGRKPRLTAQQKAQMERLPECSSGYSLDLDSTVFERYSQQQGALRGPNPRKHGRPSHPPLVAVLAEAHFLLHGWLRSGNCGSARGAVEFLKEALALLPEKHAIRVLRADAGFFDRQVLGFWSSAG
jgi:hypothetical protein